MKKIDGKKFELFTKWHLRFNGYFTIDNFIIHAADDLTKISDGTIGNYTEIDILGIRMPFSREITGELRIKNDRNLDCDGIDKIDIIIGECKTGNQNEFNKIFRDKNQKAVEYLINFCGLFKEDKKIQDIANQLIQNTKYEDEKYRLRCILFGQTKPTKSWIDKGLKFISLEMMVEFFIKDRGECWENDGIGSRSVHKQWDEMIKEIFVVINNMSLDRDKRKMSLMKILNKKYCCLRDFL